MKTTRTTLFAALAITAALALGACSKTEAPKAADAASAAAPAASKPAIEPVREATYNPNLVPGEIVWDNPEKKKAWEAHQASLKAGAKAASATGK